MDEIKPTGGPPSIEYPTPGTQPSVQTYHMGRTVKFYSVTESEFSSISYMNTLTIFFFSLGSFIIALLAPDLHNIIVSAWLGKELPQEVQAELLTSVLIIGSLALIFYGLGITTLFIRRGRWKKIGQESFTQ